MSVWPNFTQPSSALVGSEGELVSIHISIEPRLLERLLDTLAQLDFPINPEIRHAGGPVTLVEFPAWTSRVPAVREAVLSAGFDSGSLAVVGMLEAIHSERRIARATA
ncbi:MAG TPA: hypothetical protein VN428_22400 [Bryobacteraceae bacterium]|nr:hypothetical protein [Bryobacteraceae bacterium]